jgi:hypothetical protein
MTSFGLCVFGQYLRRPLGEEFNFGSEQASGRSKDNSLDYRLRQTWIFLEELHDAVSQLRMVNRQALDLVQRQQGFEQERLVFLLERQGEAVDD